MAIPQPKNQDTVKTTIRRGQKTMYFFVPEGRNGLVFPQSGVVNLTSTPTHIKPIALFCTEKEVSEVTMEAVSENTVMFGGYKNAATVTDGRMHSFTVNFSGNAISPMLAILQKAADVKGFQHPETIDLGKVGHFIIQSWGVDGNTAVIARNDLLLNVSAKLTVIPGKTVDGIDDYSIEFYSSNADQDVWTMGKNIAIVCEIAAADGGSITNGAFGGSTLVLGAGNGSYDPPTTPDAYQINPSGTSGKMDKYFFYCSINGVQQDLAQHAFNAGTETITFASALDATGTVLLIYALDVSASTSFAALPHGQAYTDNDSMLYSWSKYYGNQ